MTFYWHSDERVRAGCSTFTEEAWRTLDDKLLFKEDKRTGKCLRRIFAMCQKQCVSSRSLNNVILLWCWWDALGTELLQISIILWWNWFPFTSFQLKLQNLWIYCIPFNQHGISCQVSMMAPFHRLVKGSSEGLSDLPKVTASKWLN